MKRIVVLLGASIGVGAAAGCSHSRAESRAISDSADCRRGPGRARRRHAVLTDRRGIPAYQEIDVHAKVAGYREDHHGRRRRPRQGRTAARCSRGSRAAGRAAAGRRLGEARGRGGQPRAGRSRARRVGARGDAPRPPTRLAERQQGAAEARSRSRTSTKSPGAIAWPKRRSSTAKAARRVGARAARDTPGRTSQDADAGRLHAHHRAVCRRHHPPLRRSPAR